MFMLFRLRNLYKILFFVLFENVFAHGGRLSRFHVLVLVFYLSKVIVLMDSLPNAVHGGRYVKYRNLLIYIL